MCVYACVHACVKNISYIYMIECLPSGEILMHQITLYKILSRWLLSMITFIKYPLLAYIGCYGHWLTREQYGGWMIQTFSPNMLLYFVLVLLAWYCHLIVCVKFVHKIGLTGYRWQLQCITVTTFCANIFKADIQDTNKLNSRHNT